MLGRTRPKFGRGKPTSAEANRNMVEVWPTLNRLILASTATAHADACISLAELRVRGTHVEFAGVRLAEPTQTWSESMQTCRWQTPQFVDRGPILGETTPTFVGTKPEASRRQPEFDQKQPGFGRNPHLADERPHLVDARRNQAQIRPPPLSHWPRPCYRCPTSARVISLRPIHLITSAPLRRFLLLGGIFCFANLPGEPSRGGSDKWVKCAG